MLRSDRRRIALALSLLGLAGLIGLAVAVWRGLHASFDAVVGELDRQQGGAGELGAGDPDQDGARALAAFEQRFRAANAHAQIEVGPDGRFRVVHPVTLPASQLILSLQEQARRIIDQGVRMQRGDTG